jgi:hypothetical protein
MAEKLGGIYYEVEAKTDKLDKEVKRTEQQVDKSANKMDGSFKKVLGSLGAMVAGGLALRKVVSVMKELEAAARKQERAFKMLEAQLTATGNAAGFTASQLERMAGRLQAVSNFGDEEIMGEAMSSMLKFRAVTGKTFERAIALTVDMAAVTGNLSGAAEQLGRSLSDPTLALSLLRRQGIFFTQEQQDQIKAYQETNQLAKAQSVILTELESKYAGIASSMAEPMKQLSNLWGDLKEELGYGMVQAVDSLARTLLPFLQNAVDYMAALRRTSKKFREEFEKIDPANMEELSEAIQGNIDAIDNVSTAALALRISFAALATGIETTFKASTLPIRGMAALLSTIPGVNLDLEKSFRDYAQLVLGDAKKIEDLQREMLFITIMQSNATDEMKASLVAKYNLENYMIGETKDSIETLTAANLKAAEEARRITFGEAIESAEKLVKAVKDGIKINVDLVGMDDEDLLTDLKIVPIDASEAFESIKAMFDKIRAEEMQYNEFSIASRERMRAAWEEMLYAIAEQYGLNSREFQLATLQMEADLKRLAQKPDEVSEAIKKIQQAAQELGNSIASNIGNALGDIIVDGENWKDSFKKVADSIIKDLIRIIARMAILSALGLVIPGLGTIAGAAMTTTTGNNKGGFARNAIRLNQGGKAQKANTGMLMSGSNLNKDSVFAHLTKGEYVVNREATARNLPLLEAINSGRISPNMGGISTAKMEAQLQQLTLAIQAKNWSPSVVVQNRIDPNMVNKANRIGESYRGGFDV